MALVEKASENVDSEMEEGEIVDDLDDLSDISSEEEFLLRQRLQVLENYNNVLERKKAKDSSFGPGNHNHTKDVLLDLSEISATDLEESSANSVPKTDRLEVCRNFKHQIQKHIKSYHKPKRRKNIVPFNLSKPKDKKKIHRKKKLELKVISESSEESDDEYRNKRRKLANAVGLNRDNNDKSSLQDRLQKMLGVKEHDIFNDTLIEEKQSKTETGIEVKDVACSPIIGGHDDLTTKQTQDFIDLIDLCTDDDGGSTKADLPPIDTVDSAPIDTVDSVVKEKNENESKETVVDDSDEDLEQLRQHALKSKAVKTKIDQEVPENELSKPIILSEDEDSDTAELRLICLKSALLKKAIEMKQKQKLRKRLSQSSFTMQDDFLDEYKEFDNTIEMENNTDIESVDMDMGSDADEKGKEISNNVTKIDPVEHLVTHHNEIVQQQHIKRKIIKDDELEEDEDLLRAKLLTSLSKNLPNLVDPKVIKATEADTPPENTPPVTKTKVPENRIVINLGESDSEGENEATKNLTKMHMKLSEQIDFQQKLDMFLKSTRLEVEKTKLPDVVLNPVPNTPEKFVAKTVNHLPKSEQIEYKNLVKKMTELEKMKEARQAAMNLFNKTQVKDTLKPRNVSLDTSRVVAFNMLEEQVALSRKKIAEESSIMMKLKEEATKLSQKYKIVANELKNISTAITLNKKEQRTVQNRLSKIRLQHQRLLNSSLNKHSKVNGNMLTTNRQSNLQKENNPIEDEYKNPLILKTVKVSVANDKLEETFAPNSRLSVQVDVTSNKKIVTSFPNTVDINNTSEHLEHVMESNTGLIEEDRGSTTNNGQSRIESRITNEYESPLLSLERVNWEADPNAIMCPFVVGGNCKDPACKYLHPKVPSQ